MMKKRLSKKIWYGSDVDSEGNPVLPPLAIDSDDLEGLHYGELYLHIADDKLSLWTRTLTDQVKQIGGSGSGDGELWQLKRTDAGEPYLFSPFDVAVQRGLTSFVDGGSLDLPSIYDGLPIDNQTLYWEEVKEEVGTDEEGNPIYKTTKVLKAAGGGTGGGVADSVHWNNIEGKPDFSQYATKDSLSGYLPLSGGTMTGQINMPVGIGNAIKFGEQSRLFAYNGNLYISAEANLVLASGASGNTVPNNAVIDKTGRMFIANNLAVGHAGFIMDSYKLNVAGDAYVNGKLVVSGTIYPSISSLHNIGDSSKRFACIHADSVDVGGVKISLLQDGVLFIDGNLAVTGGITSYVDGGDLDLPSIYDGLPIDGDTLYWVLDENGKKVMLKSKGGDEEGGGSVKSLLKWSGFREGSWDGSEEKTIEIPSKLSELENDGKFFADGGWIGSDANSVIFGSYLYGGYAANTPKNVGQLLAFNNGDLESWNRGSQIFIEGENFYYRQFWDNIWKSWRRVISENADGVIDYDLTLDGSLNMPSGLAKIKSGEKSIIESYNEGGDTYVIGENYLYLTTQNLFTIKEGKVYGILHEGNYRDYEYTAKRLSVTDIRNTTPKPSDLETFSVTAQFANTDNPGEGWYSGLSIQGWTNDYKAWQLRSGAWGFASDHLYFRNGELETWNDWRRVITGDVNGVLDNIVINTDNTSAIEVNHRSASQWNFAMTAFNPMMPDGSLEIIEFGKGKSAYNAGSIGFRYFGDSSADNMMTISLYNSDEILNITGHRRVGINTTMPRHDLEVNGQIGVTNGIKLYGAEGDNIESVVNPNGCIENGIHELASIRHALRFLWYDEAYEIGTIRSNSEGAWGFGVTYNNNQLVWRVDRERMDVYGDLMVKGILDSVTITSLQEQLNGLWKRNWFEDLSATMIMADNASFERLYGDSIIIGDCKLSYDYEKKTLVIQKFDGTDTNVVISGGLTTYSTNV